MGGSGKNLPDFIFWAVTAVIALSIPMIAGPRDELRILLYGIVAIIAILIFYIKNVARERKNRTEHAEERQVTLIEEMRTGFKRIDDKVDTLTEAQQTTMRATLIHNAEKYFERGWLTPEEQNSWCDMHDKYSALGANGLIQSYRQKIDALPHRQISSILDEGE